MLIKGAVIGYSETENPTSYTEIHGCKSFPDKFGGDPSKVDNSIINAQVKRYELGQKDPGDIAFTFSYGTDEEKTDFFTIRGLEASGKTVHFQVKYVDGTTIEFSGTVVASMGGGGPDDPVTWTMSVGLQSDFEYEKGTNAAG